MRTASIDKWFRNQLENTSWLRGRAGKLNYKGLHGVKIKSRFIFVFKKEWWKYVFKQQQEIH